MKVAPFITENKVHERTQKLAQHHIRYVAHVCFTFLTASVTLYALTTAWAKQSGENARPRIQLNRLGIQESFFSNIGHWVCVDNVFIRLVGKKTEGQG